jgi:steroid delta-isomerase-like uncharacterized protein
MSLGDEFKRVWNDRSGEAFAGLFAPDGARLQLAHEETRYSGREAVAEHANAIMASWPDCELEIRGEAVSGDTVTIEWTFRGTQQADYGPIPAKGQALELKGVSVCTLDGEGRVREERVYWDNGTLMAGAGMLG